MSKKYGNILIYITFYIDRRDYIEICYEVIDGKYSIL